MTIKEFFESSKKLAIHCNSKEKAKKLLRAFDTANYKWFSGARYTEENNWDTNGKETCYSNRNRFCDKNFYETMGYNILEFEDIEFEDIEFEDNELSKEKLIEIIQEKIDNCRNDIEHTKNEIYEIQQKHQLYGIIENSDANDQYCKLKKKYERLIGELEAYIDCYGLIINLAFKNKS